MFDNQLPIFIGRTEMTIQDGTVCITQKAQISSGKVTKTNYELTDRVDKLIKWATKNVAPIGHTPCGIFCYPERLRNLIEKVAFWYELRYTNNEVNQLCYYGASEDINMDEILFHKKMSDGQSVWSQGFDKDTFLSTLENQEGYLLKEPEFPSRKMEGLTYFYQIQFQKIIDEKTKQQTVVATFPTLDDANELIILKKNVADVITEYYNACYLHQELLNCIMYRIIDHEANRVGPRRAMLFAKEFGTDIRVPMQYGVDTSDPGLKNEIEFYLSLGGTPDIDCLINYSWREKKNQTLEIESLKKIMAREHVQEPQQQQISDQSQPVLKKKKVLVMPK